MALTPDDVRQATFDTARHGEVGYDRYEVDAFLDRVEATLAGMDGLTAADVSAVRFTQSRQGTGRYSAKAVDAFLDEVVLTMTAPTAPARTGVQDAPPRPPLTSSLSSPSALLQQGPHQWDPREQSAVGPVVPPQETVPPQEMSAFDEDEVDAYLERIQATLAGEDSLTAQDVLTATFNPPSPGRPGYSQPSVQAFLILAATSLTRLGSRARTGTRRPLASAPRQSQHPPADTPDGQWRRPLPRRPSSRRSPTARDVLPAPQPAAPPRVDPPTRHPDTDRDAVRRPGARPAPYDKDEVHFFLARLKATLAGADTVTAQDVLAATFNPPPPGRPGYSENEFLALVATTLDRPDRRTDGRTAVPRLTPEEIHNVQLRPPPPTEPGYAADQVDALLDRVEATLAGRDTLTAQQVHDVKFRQVPPGQGGYQQSEVDALLDLVEDHLADSPTRRPA